MTKYAVESGLAKQSGIEEFDLLSIFDSYEEADSYAQSKSELSDGKCIRVGEITDENLDKEGDWLSYKRIDILTEYGAE